MLHCSLAFTDSVGIHLEATPPMVSRENPQGEKSDNTDLTPSPRSSLASCSVSVQLLELHWRGSRGGESSREKRGCIGEEASGGRRGVDDHGEAELRVMYPPSRFLRKKSSHPFIL